MGGLSSEVRAGGREGARVGLWQVAGRRVGGAGGRGRGRADTEARAAALPRARPAARNP